MSDTSYRPTLFIGGPEDGKTREIHAQPWSTYCVLEYSDSAVLWDPNVDIASTPAPIKHTYFIRPLQGDRERWFLAIHESLDYDVAMGMVLGAYSKPRLKGEAWVCYKSATP